MAKMVPNWSDADLELAVPDTKNGGEDSERELYRFMRDELPDSWIVVYSTYIEVVCPVGGQMEDQEYKVHPRRGMEYRENQFDFLVFVPGIGVVNVDAKGWGYRCIAPNDVRWRGLATRHNVIKQAKDAIHTFNEYVRKKYSNGRSWGAFDSLVVFVKDDPGVQGGVVYGNVRDLVRGSHRLEEKILGVLTRHNLQDNNSRYYPEYEKALLNEFKAVALTDVTYPADYISLENYSQMGLLHEQAVIHAIIMDPKVQHPYVWVQGGAGTGKTILGTRCAEEFAGRGKRVLYVCYNKVLAARLSLHNPYPDRLVYAHFNGLPQALVNRDLTVSGAGGRPDWKRTAAKIVNELPDMLGRNAKFDVVIVDEAQDITRGQLALFPGLMVGGQRHVVIMSDPGQTIYRHNDFWTIQDLKARFPGINELAPMRRNYRNTDKIYNHYKDAAFFEMEPRICDNLIDVNGNPYATYPVVEDDVPVEKLVEVFLGDETRSCSDLAVLTYSTASLRALPSRIQVGTGRRVKLSENLNDWLEGKVVYKSTIHSFKGLEANCLILVDDYDRIPPEAQEELESIIGDVRREDRRDFLRYVGESRAKFKLIITKKA